jgi:hypothetical protein
MADGPVRDFAMSATGGWAVVNGDFGTVAGSAAVPQGIAIRTRMFLGDCWLDGTKGVDYQGKILVKNPDPLEVRAELAAAILDTPDVTDAVGAGLQGPTAQRTATISFQAATIYGDSPVAGEVQVMSP